MLQNGAESYLPEIGHRYGHNVDRGCRIVGSRRTRLRVVFNGFGELYPRRVYIYCTRLPISCMEHVETHVLPRFAVEK